MSKAEELISCLEGEIAKRDARIVELEQQVIGMRLDVITQVDAHAVTRAELAAIKAQDPVANSESGLEEWAAGKFGVGGAFRGELCGNTDWALARLVWSAALAYAAPVSEAKAQGVVMPKGWIPLTIEHEPGYPEDVAFGPKRMMDRLKKWLDRYFEMRLNAAPVQQVSVPDGFRVMNPTSAVVRDGDRWEIYAPCGSGGIVHEDDVRDWVVRKLLDAIAAAPAAPATDASDVLDQAMYTLISIGYHENSGLVHELRQALAAHSAKGVV